MDTYVAGLQAKQSVIPHLEYSPGKRVDIREHWLKIRRSEGFLQGRRGFATVKRTGKNRKVPEAEFHRRNFSVAVGWITMCVEKHIDRMWEEGIRDEDKSIHFDYLLVCIAILQWLTDEARTKQRFENVPHCLMQWDGLNYNLADLMQAYSFAEEVMSETPSNPTSAYRKASI